MNPQRSLLVFALVLVGAGFGWLANEWIGPKEPSVASSLVGGPCPDGAKPRYWKAPMDPSYVRNEPGKSPMGMDLIPVCTGEASASAVVAIDPTLLQSMGVRTALVEERDVSRTIRAVGRVGYDERRVSHIHTKVQGWIEKLYVEYEGQMVEPGEPLLEIYSPQLLATQEELLVAARYRATTGESSFPDVQQAGQALFEATRRRLELWDIPDRDIEQLLASGKIRKTITLYAPKGGAVTQMMARHGMEVGSRDHLYTIADLSHVWVYADVYEYELPWVEVGQAAQVELSYLPGVTLSGVATYIYPLLDPKTRTARVRVELENPDLILKPDMFANVTIRAGTREGALVVPDAAIIRSGTRTIVIRDLGEGRFEPRTVHLGLDTGEGWVEVKEGVAAGERVVTSGQFLIDSESRLREAFQKLLSTELPGPGDSQLEQAKPPGAGDGAPSAPGRRTPAVQPKAEQ